MRILCCADLHLGRESALLINPESRFDRTAVGAWQRIVELAIEEKADAVAIAGDVFDGGVAAQATRRRFLEGLNTLAQAKIPVVAVAGNHDHQALPSFATGPDGRGLRLLGRDGRWQEAEIETRSGTIRFVGWSFPKATCREAPLASFDLGRSALPTVGLLHGDLAPLSPYAPLTAQALDNAPVDAWVLGHIHKPGLVSEKACYPGSPQALDPGPGEAGNHGVFWLDVAPGRRTFSDLVPLSTVYYDSERLTVEGLDAIAEVETALRERNRRILDLAPSIQSVQTRVRLVQRQGEPLNKEPRQFAGSDDAWQAVSSSVETVRDPFEIAKQSDAAGIAAQCLLGVRAFDGHVDGQPVEADWVKMADGWVEKGLGEAKKAFDQTLGAVKDLAHEAKGWDQEAARDQVRDQLEASLREWLANYEKREGQRA